MPLIPWCANGGRTASSSASRSTWMARPAQVRRERNASAGALPRATRLPSTTPTNACRPSKQSPAARRRTTHTCMRRRSSARPGSANSVRKAGVLASSLQADCAVGNQSLQALIQGLHARRRRGLHRRVDLRDLLLPDQVAHSRRRHQDLVCRDPPSAHGARWSAATRVRAFATPQQRLPDHRLQGFGEHGAYRLLFAGRKDIDDTVNGLGRGRRMQGGKDHVTRFRGGQCQPDGLQIAHFADQDHVRVLPQRGAQRIGG